jgi:hypothetical protein
MPNKNQNQKCGEENTVMGGSDLSLEGPDQEVTNGAGETKDKEAGSKTATSVDNEVNDGVGEKEVMVASENAQQGPESKIATTVDKDVTNKNKNADAIDLSQTEQIGESKDSQKKQNQRQIKLRSLQKILVQKRITIWKTVSVQ